MERYILVTGAAGGMGQAVIREARRRGYLVFAGYHSTPAAAAEGVFPVRLDVTSAGSLAACEAEIRRHTDHLYAIVQLAGRFSMDSITEGDEEGLRQSMEVNFWGAYRVFKQFFPLLDPGGSRIIIMSSEVSGLSPAPFNGYYAIPKRTLDSFIDVLRRELAYLDIPVSKIRSGAFRTAMLDSAAHSLQRMRRNSRLFRREIAIFEPMISRELARGSDPGLMGRLVGRILDARRPRARYRIKNSRLLAAMNTLPESLQDRIYLLMGRLKKSPRR